MSNQNLIQQARTFIQDNYVTLKKMLDEGTTYYQGTYSGMMNRYYFNKHRDFVLRFSSFAYCSMWEGYQPGAIERSNNSLPLFNAYVPEDKEGMTFEDSSENIYMIGEPHPEGYGRHIYTVEIFSKEEGMYLLAQSSIALILNLKAFIKQQE
jgi:hypothetical protein